MIDFNPCEIAIELGLKLNTAEAIDINIKQYQRLVGKLIKFSHTYLHIFCC